MGYTTQAGYVKSSGGASFGGADQGPLGNGNKLIWDDDENTYSEVQSNDRIDHYLGGTLRYSFKGGRISIGNSGGIESDNAGAVDLGRDFRGWKALWLNEVSAPTITDSDNLAVYAVDNGGSTELRVKFPNGTVKTIATDV